MTHAGFTFRRLVKIGTVKTSLGNPQYVRNRVGKRVTLVLTPFSDGDTMLTIRTVPNSGAHFGHSTHGHLLAPKADRWLFKTPPSQPREAFSWEYMAGYNEPRGTWWLIINVSSNDSTYPSWWAYWGGKSND